VKIAVLISGEYRKFDITRKTMTFLDNPNVDVYISTWDKTIYSSPKINLTVEELVTEERVLKDMGRPATVKIDTTTLINEEKYNSKMINRWLAGWKLIQDSGIKYDYVMITRPDLYFHPVRYFDINNIEQYKDNIGFVWATSMHLGKLPDVLFLSCFSSMDMLMKSLTVDLWADSSETDWHIWWYEHVHKLFPKILNAEEYSYITFCRYWVNETHTFIDAVNIHHDWRDLRILNECDMWGDDFAIGIWPDEVLISAKEKWNNGYFDKYK
jgi:hypothetical protein